jgi:hypothetical protein
MSAKDEVFWLIQRYGYARRNGQYQGKKSAEWMGEISKAIDAAVAEARAPLVKVLRAIERKVECPLCGEAIGCGHAANCPLAAALAKETP